MIENKILKGEIEMILQSDHHLYMDNPLFLVFKIIKQTHGKAESQEYLRIVERRIKQ